MMQQAAEPTFTRSELEAELANASTVGTIEAALGKIIRLRSELKNKEYYGRVLQTPGLDALVPRLARKLKLKDVTTQKSNDNVCILTTAVYGTGGHSRVVSDIIAKLGPDLCPVLITTDVYNQLQIQALLNHPENNSGLGERACLKMSAGTLVERIIELYMTLLAIRPSRVILLSHPMDMVAVAGAWPFRDIVEFVHHSDHFPAIGVGLPFSAHVDVTYTCHQACRRSGIDAVYAGMTSAVVQPPPHDPHPDRLRIATCGNIHKFQAPGHYAWTDYVVAALRRPGAEIIHIGLTTPEFDERIRKALTAARIDPSRYVFAGLRDLGEELVARQVDVYLSSYPEPGGKANLEAMAADIPVIVATDTSAAPLSRFSLPLPRYIDISKPDDLRPALDRALDLHRSMRSPEQAEVLRRELGRFDDFVAGRRPAPAEDALAT
jgi:hypothetical protein